MNVYVLDLSMCCEPPETFSTKENAIKRVEWLIEFCDWEITEIYHGETSQVYTLACETNPYFKVSIYEQKLDETLTQTVIKDGEKKIIHI